jgi:hypothetical protein
MHNRRRLLVFGSALVLTISAAAWVSETPEDVAVVAPVARKTSGPKEAAGKSLPGSAAGLLLDKLARTPTMVGDLNPFNAKSWYVPPPPPPLALPPKPTAPPLPFTYMGKLEDEGGRWIIYLAKGEQSYVVKKGETFDSVYRLDGMENGNLVIQYLPLSTKQLLPIGGAF